MRLSGFIVLCLFAAGWGCAGLKFLGAPVWQLAVPVVISTVMVMIARLSKFGNFQLPEDARKRVAGVLRAAFIFEGIAIPVTIIALKNTGHADLIVAGVAAIVGLHFFPLALGIPWPVYWFTGIAMIAITAVAFVLPAGMRGVVVGIGCALILWLSAVMGLLAGRRAAAGTAQ